MAMKGQVYNIKHTEKAGLAKPAQFVFENNDSNEIIGFIFSVSEDDYITIALFEPKELPDAAIILEEEITEDELTTLLAMALADNPSMRKYWDTL